MSRLLLGLNLDALGQPPRQGLLTAAKHGVSGVQIDAAGDLAPDRLTATGRREFRTLLRSFNLQLAAVHCPLRRGLDVADDQQRRVEYVGKAIGLAGELACRSVIVPLPKLPGEEPSPRAAVLREALGDLSRLADRVGVRLAVEPGLDDGAAVAKYLDGFATGGLAACYDPANFLLNRFAPVASLVALGQRVAVVQARDGRLATVSGSGAETAVGAGDLDWFSLVATLDAGDYRGFVVVDREGGPDRPGDIAAGVQFLKRFLTPSGSA
jgi:sugar phosphate isomerase/epimerase